MASRRELRERGAAVRARLFGPSCQLNESGGFDDFIVETTYGSIWSRPGLELRDRMVCTLAALCAVQQLAALRRYVGAALNLDLAPATPLAIFAQVGTYTGFAAVEAAMGVAHDVYRARGVTAPAMPDEPLDLLEQRGRALMAKLHGERATAGYAAPDNAFTNRLYPMTIPYGYGYLWHLPGLTLPQRAMASLAAFTALHLHDQLRKFGASALNVGLSVDEVCEAVIQTAPYSGYAPALNALRCLGEVLAP